MTPRLNWLDRAIGVVAPKAAYRRGLVRSALDMARGYEGAAIGRRTEAWRTGRTSADAEISRALITLRNRSRDLHRNNPHARKGKSVWVSNIVGTGIEPRPASGNPALDRQAMDLFSAWSQSCDADGQLDWGGLQQLAVSEMVEGGEALIRRRLRRPEDGFAVPLQLQLLEGDLLDESKTLDLGTAGRIVNGVEFDPIGQRRAYWMFASHPGNASLTASANVLSRATPASEIAHLYRKERTQARGVPWCAAIIQRSRDLDDYEDAEIVRKKTESCVVAIVLGGDVDDSLAPRLGVKDANGNAIERFEPGLIAYSDGGREVKFNNPGQSGSYPEYMKVGLHSVAAGYLIPYELMTGDLSEVSFTSHRAGLIEFRRLVEAIQWLCVIPMALLPIWRWFCEAAYLAGKLPVPYVPVEWDTPRFESVNPLDDANAELIALRSGTATLFELIGRRTGRNPRVVLQEIAAANELLDELGLILDSDPRHVSRVGVEQPDHSAPPARTNGRPALRPVN